MRAQSVFAEIKSLLDSANASLKLVFIEGRPSQSILHYVKQANCDLLLLGAVGHSLLERMLGSVSDSVATNSHCSVLIVRPTSPSQSKSPIRLCVAYDESPASRATIEQLETVRWGVNSSIDVLGVYLMPFAYSDIPIAIDLDQLKVSKERVVEEASKELTRLSPNVHSHVIEAGHAGDAIVDFAKTHASDIIVLGNENNDLLDRFLMGSTSRYVLRHAKCSVWICRKGKQ